IADLDESLGCHHHAFVQERPGADPHARGAGRGDPRARLQERPRSDLQAPLSQSLEHVAVHGPAHEGLTPQELPMDARPIPGKRVLLIPAPLLSPQPGLARGLGGGFFAALAATPAFAGTSSSARNLPVWDDGSAATSSGVPTAIAIPPSSPPSGPMSISLSAHLITSRLCSITTMLLPASTRRWSTSSRRCTSAKCRPVVGSSRM